MRKEDHVSVTFHTKIGLVLTGKIQMNVDYRYQSIVYDFFKNLAVFLTTTRHFPVIKAEIWYGSCKEKPGKSLPCQRSVTV